MSTIKVKAIKTVSSFSSSSEAVFKSFFFKRTSWVAFSKKLLNKISYASRNKCTLTLAAVTLTLEYSGGFKLRTKAKSLFYLAKTALHCAQDHRYVVVFGPRCTHFEKKFSVVT